MLLIFPPALQAQALTPPPEGAKAQAPLSLDLSSALARARNENPMLRAAKARVEERRGLITSTRADALPQLTLVGDFTRARDVSILNSGFADSAAAFGLSPNSLVGARSIYTSQANLTQPLFYWGKLGTAIDIAKMGEQEAAFGFTTSELDVLHGVAKAYLGVLSAQAEQEVIESRRSTAEQFVSDVKAKLEAQTATELDRLRAESELLAVIPEALQAEAQVKRALEVLNGQLGLDPKTPLSLAQMGLPEIGAKPAGAERSELAQLRQQEAMYRANEKIITSDLRPKFDLSASYGYQAGKTENLWKEPYDTWKVSVTMKFPIFDGLRSSGKRAQNTAQLEQVKQARIDRERSVAIEQSTADRELEKAIALNEAARRAHDATVEALRMSRESFEQGLITSLDLLQAERAERQAESQRRRAELGLWSARFDQRRSLGLPPL
ncbi:TolC family protein [Geothrix sp. PMB-07]|uniref:TolC family protein n=1 Tax=Geothrix sp. PMB-07 TaxID=3068640 RepID=UPI00274084B5|nr:TolC family protein [Geothrix sp. PMB-07]WLT32510.1 TolC family protein [Geothrix sp. PMB-07]